MSSDGAVRVSHTANASGGGFENFARSGDRSSPEERYAILSAHSLDRRPRREQTGRQPAPRHDPVAHHQEPSQTRKRIAQRPEAHARRQQPTLHAAFPVIRVANDGGRGRHINHFDRIADVRHHLFENRDNRLFDPALFRLVTRRVIAL